MSSAESESTSEAPKLLLDTNVYLDLLDGHLAGQRERIVKVASHKTPPLLWACDVTFYELVCRLDTEVTADFEKYRRALWWMEKLCGGRGMAEAQKWVLCTGVFAGAMPFDHKLGAALVSVRREIIAAQTFVHISPVLRAKIDELRTGYSERINNWVADRTILGQAARAEFQAGDPRVVGSEIADGVLEISRQAVSVCAPAWGAFRSDEDQKRAQRELIAFEMSYLQKAKNSQPYNYKKHRSDYNDYWLCAYCAAGYTLVTADDRLRRSIEDGGCSDPRIVTPEDGFALAEAWLAQGR